MEPMLEIENGFSALIGASNLGRNRGQTTAICGRKGHGVIERKQRENRSQRCPIAITRYFTLIARVCANTKSANTQTF